MKILLLLVLHFVAILSQVPFLRPPVNDITSKPWYKKVSNDNGVRAVAILSTKKLYIKTKNSKVWEAVVNFITPSDPRMNTPADYYLIDVRRTH